MSKRKSSGEGASLVLFRNDLRVADNGALTAAASTGKPVIAVFVLDEESERVRPAGGASRWWLHHSLAALKRSLAALGLPLVLRGGQMKDAAAALVEESGADTVLWNRRYDPGGVAADMAMKRALQEEGIRAQSFDGHLLHEPSLLKTGSGGPYKRYSAFWNALTGGPDPRDPLPAPRKIERFSGKIDSRKLEEFDLLPGKPDWAGGLRESWTPGEEGAHARLDAFLSKSLDGYARGRELPSKDATSHLSPHLAHGEITPFQIFAALAGRKKGKGTDAATFRKEVGWREFCHHLLFHNPELHEENFQAGFDSFPWRRDRKALAAWQEGLTGYPIVDAGMRELWRTGAMHNRVRMIAASFLTKHLLLDWRQGESWFWDTLVDADPANNPGNWQWVAGSGADAAPYFRIFNPVLQGEKFDADGAYVRRWVPEIARLPDKHLHKPWQAPKKALEEAGIRLGDTYPAPIVDHAMARERALAAYRQTRNAR